MKRSLLAAACSLAFLSACAGQNSSTDAPHNATLAIPTAAAGIATLQHSANRGPSTLTTGPEGLRVTGVDGAEQSQLAGTFDMLDSRGPFDVAGRPTHLALTLDDSAGLPVLIAVDAETLELESIAQVPARHHRVEGLCLYRDPGDNLFAFLLDGSGAAGQWLLYDGSAGRTHIAEVRQLPVPPGSEYCDVDDGSGALFISEENLGIWRYNAAPETETKRQLIDTVPPHGDLPAPVGDLQALSGNLAAALPEHGLIRLYATSGTDGYKATDLPLPAGVEPNAIAATGQNDIDALLVADGESNRVLRLPLPALPARTVAGHKPYPVVKPTAETAPVDNFGDAADDPAIWVHPQEPTRSRILGTDKQWGLKVYSLEGELLQSLATGKVNNVDLRQGAAGENGPRDIAVASNRTDNSIAVYDIDRDSGEVKQVGSIATDLSEIYGICMYMPSPGDVYAIANDKNGRFQQYRLPLDGDAVGGAMVREFAVGSQPEGCVADDASGQLFIGEEAVGVWVLSGDPDVPTQLLPVAAVAGEDSPLVADVEGLALYHGPQTSYLVVSSQGDNSYALFDATAPYPYRGSVRIGMVPSRGIDGASETDGLAVTSQHLGTDYPDGLLVVQDGRNFMPEQPQNFKLVSWRQIARILAL